MANYWQKALNAVFYANPVKLQKLVDEGHIYPLLLKDTAFFYAPLPIWRIPQLWEDTIHDPDDWKEESQGTVASFLERVHQVKDILQKAFGIEYTPVDYHSFLSDLSFREEEDTIEEILGVDDVNCYVDSERRLIDIELYCAREKYDFAKVKELLLQGANPNVPIPDDDSNLYDDIGVDCAFYSIEIWPYIEEDQHEPVDGDMMYNLLRSAAEESLYRLVEQYDTTPEGQRRHEVE